MTPTRYVPITLGASSFLRRDLTGFRVAELRYAPDVQLAPHEHDRASFNVMLEGGIDVTLRNRAFTCLPTMTTVEPTDTRHTNHVSRRGARVLVIQFDVMQRQLPRSCEALLATPSQMKSSRLFQLARALSRELEHPADTSDLYVEGLAC